MNNKIREYSLPLILGVIGALVWVNLSPESYNTVVFGVIFGEEISFQWLIENVFMVFFFATAMVEIVNSVSPGGALNPIKKAINPVFATFGGVIGPAVLYIVLNMLIGSDDYSNGWGICTATDIAISWLAARVIFGPKHAATSFLLLLAVLDDAIGLVIIAVFYPSAPPEPIWLLLCVGGMVVAFVFNRMKIASMLPYIVVGGGLCWAGLFMANLSPALSLVFIVPFFPRTRKVVEHEDCHGVDDAEGHSTLANFEHRVSPIIDYGLIFFGLTSAGVAFSTMGILTAIVTISTIVGKTLGIFIMSELAHIIGFKRPNSMGLKELLVVGIIAGMGLTVALFVANVAFDNPLLIGTAKMGSLFTISAFLIAFIFAKILGVKKEVSTVAEPVQTGEMAE